MKQYLGGAAALLVVAGLSGCTDDTASEDAASAEVAQSIYDAFAAGDIDGFTALLHPDIVWNEAENFPYADNNPYQGPDGVLGGVMARIGAEWDGFTATPETMIAQGDRVAVQGRYTGTYIATGESINAQFVHVWTVQDGQMIAFQQYADTWQVREASGLD